MFVSCFGLASPHENNDKDALNLQEKQNKFIEIVLNKLNKLEKTFLSF